MDEPSESVCDPVVGNPTTANECSCERKSPRHRNWQRFWALQQKGAQLLRTRPIEELYNIREADVALPPMARVFTSIICARCAEPTMETRIRHLAGDQLCAPCFQNELPQS
jgi:formylmethanofuran dehydrogenase subunit E